MNLPSPDAAQVVLTLTTLAAIWLGWAKVLGPWVKRKWDRFVGIFQAIAGRDPIVDKASGKELAPAMPPLGEQLSTINDTMQKLVIVIESNHDAHKRIDNHEGRLSATERDIAAMKLAAVERIVTKDEAAQMWRAVANSDILPGESTET